ncbi:MAG TPA: hypothetical protein VF221_23660 [Chloroflexota bacterium]
MNYRFAATLIYVVCLSGLLSSVSGGNLATSASAAPDASRASAAPALTAVLNSWKEVQEDTALDSYEQKSTQHRTLRAADGPLEFASRLFGKAGPGTFGVTSIVYRYTTPAGARQAYATHGNGAGLLGTGMIVVFRRAENLGDGGTMVGYDEKTVSKPHFTGGAVIWHRGRYVGITSVHSQDVHGGYAEDSTGALNLARDMTRRMTK